MKILYVTTVISTMDFFIEHIKMLQGEGHVVDLATNVVSPINDSIKNLNCRIHQIDFSRNPFSKDNLKAYQQLKDLIKKEKYDIIHTHTPNASAIVRMVCLFNKQKNRKVIYTAHGFHFYKGAHWKNWVIFFPVEWICSFFTDTLITINQELM